MAAYASTPNFASALEAALAGGERSLYRRLKAAVLNFATPAGTSSDEGADGPDGAQALSFGSVFLGAFAQPALPVESTVGAASSATAEPVWQAKAGGPITPAVVPYNARLGRTRGSPQLPCGRATGGSYWRYVFTV